MFLNVTWMYYDWMYLYVIWIYLNVHECNLNVFWMFMNVIWMCFECIMNVSWMYRECIVNVLWMYLECIMNVNVSRMWKKFYSRKCAALFPGSLLITIYNPDKEIWYGTSYAKLLLKIFQNKKDRRKVCDPVISTQLLWLTSRIFLYQWKSTKICRKAKDDILLHFSCLFGQL